MLRLSPLLNASPAIQIHVAAALGAIALGAVQFIAPKGTIGHRTLGWAWVVLLSGICISSFFIPGSWFIWGISVFHALSVYTLWALAMGVWAARQGRVVDHKSYMAWLYVLSVLISAVIAVISSGVLSEVFLGEVSNRNKFES